VRILVVKPQPPVRREDRWFCTCGHQWDAFETADVSPPRVRTSRHPALLDAAFARMRAQPRSQPSGEPRPSGNGTKATVGFSQAA